MSTRFVKPATLDRAQEGRDASSWIVEQCPKADHLFPFAAPALLLVNCSRSALLRPLFSLPSWARTTGLYVYLPSPPLESSADPSPLSCSALQMPTFQTFFVYFFLNLVYTPYTIYRYGFKTWLKMVFSLQGLFYLFLAAVDVEANFLVVKAYGNTDLLSCMLLDAWATPACMIFAFFLVRARYHWSQILGVLICIAGLGLVSSRRKAGTRRRARRRSLTILGFESSSPATSSPTRTTPPRTGCSVTFICYLVLRAMVLVTVSRSTGSAVALFTRSSARWASGECSSTECRVPVSQKYATMPATSTDLILATGLEHELFKTVSWQAENIGYLIGYTCAMLFLYTLAPILFRLSSSPFYNLR